MSEIEIDDDIGSITWIRFYITREQHMQIDGDAVQRDMAMAMRFKERLQCEIAMAVQIAMAERIVMAVAEGD